MIKADLLSGIAFTVLGTAAFIQSFRMPRFLEVGSSLYEAPGVVPGFLGLIITILGVTLAIRAGVRLATRSKIEEKQSPSHAKVNASSAKLLLTLLLTVVYACCLIGNLPFWLATGLFIFIFITVFEWDLVSSRSAKIRMVIFASIQSIVVSATVTFVFQEVFLVSLP